MIQAIGQLVVDATPTKDLKLGKSFLERESG